MAQVLPFLILVSAKSGFGFWFQFLSEEGVGVFLQFQLSGSGGSLNGTLHWIAFPVEKSLPNPSFTELPPSYVFFPTTLSVKWRAPI